jgi:carbamoyl-phosphate synthase large subunit
MEQLQSTLPRLRDPLIQELVGSQDTEYTCGVIYFDGDVKGSIALRRYLKDGNTASAYFSKDTPEIIYEYIHETAKTLKPFGPCNFQLRMDTQDI